MTMFALILALTGYAMIFWGARTTNPGLRSLGLKIAVIGTILVALVLFTDITIFPES